MLFRNEEEQNLIAYQYKGEIYYKVYKEIKAGTELLVYYGDEFAKHLGIIRNLKSTNKDSKDVKKLPINPLLLERGQ